MPNSLSFKPKQLEQMLLAVAAAQLMLAVFGPDIAQPTHQHAFADARRWFSVPNAMDVLSNIAFAAGGVAGLLGVCRLLQRVRVTAEHALAALFLRGWFARRRLQRGTTCGLMMQAWALTAWAWWLHLPGCWAWLSLATLATEPVRRLLARYCCSAR